MHKYLVSICMSIYIMLFYGQINDNYILISASNKRILVRQFMVFLFFIDYFKTVELFIFILAYGFCFLFWKSFPILQSPRVYLFIHLFISFQSSASLYFEYFHLCAYSTGNLCRSRRNIMGIILFHSVFLMNNWITNFGQFIPFL